ncbi:MAG: extracellular solute-binding protein [Mariniblastus sp.]
MNKIKGTKIKASLVNLKPCFYCVIVSFCAGLVVFCAGCIAKTDNEVVVYSALDREFSEPILKRIGPELDLRILPKFDQESNKTVGLVTEIIQSKVRPQADVFWNNEILHTLRLQKMGLLEVYRSPAAEVFPSQYISSRDQWHGFAARARVLIVNTNLISDPNQMPDSIYDLADPKWKNKCAIARPLFGTTATHAAVLFATLGEKDAVELLTNIANNAVVEGGNKQVAIKVARGEYAFGLTDTDDAMIELNKANPVAIVFPDQKSDQMGALLIPNTLSIIKNGPNPSRARMLVDRLLAPDVEVELAESQSAQIPLNPSITTKSPAVPDSQSLKIMNVDFERAAEQWDQATKIMTRLFPVGN